MKRWIALNYLAFLLMSSLLVLGVLVSWPLALAALYLLPPLLARGTVLIFGAPRATTPVPSRASYVWWVTAQLQVPFMRFPALEELLRCVPGLYSAWLRLWGAEIGAFVFWSPQVLVADRPFVRVGERAVIGYGAKLTAHLLSREAGKNVLIFGVPVIGAGAILGTLSGVGPGAQVGAGQTLKATTALPPYHKLKDKVLYDANDNITHETPIMLQQEALS